MKESEKKESSFWAILRSFWTDERVDEWYHTIFEEDAEKGLDGCHNMLCLAAHMHSHWNDGIFALKPLPASITNEDEMQERAMRIQFFWQPLYEHQRVSLSTKPLVSEGLLATGGVTAGWYTFNDNGDQITAHATIRSGDIFRVTTSDPEKHPLPSRALLDMQWVLQRIVAMRGAADMLEDDEDDEATVGDAYDGHAILSWLEASPSLDETGTRPLSSISLSPKRLLGMAGVF